MTPTEEQNVIDDLNNGKDPVRISKFWNVPLSEVKAVAGRLATERAVGKARPDLSQYAIATKAVNDRWPEIPEITQARQDYEDGMIEMVTGRSHDENGRRGAFQTLYAIPRKTVAKRNPWFTRIEE